MIPTAPPDLSPRTMVLVGGSFSGGTTLTVDLIAAAFGRQLGATMAHSENDVARALCHRWIDEPIPVLRGFAPRLFPDVKATIDALIADDVWLLKHPNLLSMAPMIAHALAPRGHRVVTVGVRRNLDDIVRSLVHRRWYGQDEAPLRVAASLLVAQAIQADIVFDYDRARADPVATTERLVRELALATGWNVERSAVDVAAVIRPAASKAEATVPAASPP